MIADRILDCCTAVREFLSNFRRTLEGQQRMREGVISDHVSGIYEFADNIRPLLHVASDQEKSRLHIVAARAFRADAACGDRWGRRRK